MLLISLLGATALTTGFADGTGQIWLDNVQCIGNETTLASCNHPAFGSHNCIHSEDAGVRCAAAGEILYIVTSLRLLLRIL